MTKAPSHLLSRPHLLVGLCLVTRLPPHHQESDQETMFEFCDDQKSKHLLGIRKDPDFWWGWVGVKSLLLALWSSQSQDPLLWVTRLAFF